MTPLAELTEEIRTLIADSAILPMTDPAMRRERQRARLERLLVGKIEPQIAGRWRGAVLMKAEQNYGHYVVMDPDDYKAAIIDSYRHMLRDVRILQRRSGMTMLQAQTEIVQVIEDLQRKTFTRL